jgi:hypothetical protein
MDPKEAMKYVDENTIGIFVYVIFFTISFTMSLR